MGQAKDNRALRIATMKEFQAYLESCSRYLGFQYADLTENNCAMFKAFEEMARDAWFSARGVNKPYIGEKE